MFHITNSAFASLLSGDPIYDMKWDSSGKQQPAMTRRQFSHQLNINTRCNCATQQNLHIINPLEEPYVENSFQVTYLSCAYLIIDIQRESN